MISIVLPVYNGQKYIRQSIDSVLNQTYTNWELIIVNDCSSDETPSIIKSYSDIDSRIKIVNNNINMRLPKSLNIGFSIAKGDYFTWTSDDNIYEPTALEKMHEFLVHNPDYGLVYADMNWIDKENSIIRIQSFSVEKIYAIDVVGACFLYTRKAAIKTGIYDDEMILLEDYDYWIRLSKNYKIYHIKEVLYSYRQHGENLFITKRKMFINQINKFRVSQKDYLFENSNSEVREKLFLEMYLLGVQRNELQCIKQKYFNNSMPNGLLFWERRHDMKQIIDNNKKIILFGSGLYGLKALEFFTEDKVEYFVDNNIQKQGKYIEGKKVISFKEYISVKDDYNLIISVASYNSHYLSEQLEENGVTEYYFYQEFVNKLRSLDKSILEDKIDLKSIKIKALSWIGRNSIKNEGIIVSTNTLLPYPEVSGYYIPTLINYNEMELAKQYAKWLIDIQNEDGSWNDCNNQSAYVFDTGQILKGLVAIYKYMPEVKQHIIRAADWLISRIDNKGKFITPSVDLWDDQSCSDLIHIYCISPLYDVGRIFKEDKYILEADRAKNYYIEERRNEILAFDILTHFYAYVMEALYDLDEINLLKEAMQNIKEVETEYGAIPAYKDVDWVCSTGMIQLALVWYKMGEVERGDKLFSYSCKLQNSSGGWYGSYPVIDNPRLNDIKNYPTYFADSEISWAVKYCLDVIYQKNKKG